MKYEIDDENMSYKGSRRLKLAIHEKFDAPIASPTLILDQLQNIDFDIVGDTKDERINTTSANMATSTKPNIHAMLKPILIYHTP